MSKKKTEINYADVYQVTLPNGKMEQLEDGSKWRVGSVLYHSEDENKTPLWVIVKINHTTKKVIVAEVKKIISG
jgi:hypothetical protein